MKYALPIVGVALVLSLSGTAYAADHDRGQRGPRDQATQQSHDNRGFDRSNGPRGSFANTQSPRRFDSNRQPKPTVTNQWRNQNARMHWQQYRRNFTSPKRYRVGRYQNPRGFTYRRWSYGERLPSIYFARPFWLFNAIAYGLFTPPPGLIWVRYGDDALLVDQYTGEIVQVRYNVFY